MVLTINSVALNVIFPEFSVVLDVYQLRLSNANSQWQLVRRNSFVACLLTELYEGGGS
jgi:hypothetical protein